MVHDFPEYEDYRRRDPITSEEEMEEEEAGDGEPVTGGQFWTMRWSASWPRRRRLQPVFWFAGLLVFALALSWVVSLAAVAASGRLCFLEENTAVLAAEISGAAAGMAYGLVVMDRSM